MYKSSLPKWIMRYVEFNKFLGDHIATKLTTYIGDVWIVDPQFNQRNWARPIKHFTSYRFKANNEINLPTVWWCVKIKNFTKRKRNMRKKHSKSFQLKASTETILPPMLIMYEVWVIQKHFRHMQHGNGFS